MIIGVLKEPHAANRVSLLPEHIGLLKKLQCDILIEHNAGVKSFASDEMYEAAGAMISDRNNIIEKSSLILSIDNPVNGDIDKMQGKVLVGAFAPLNNQQIIDDGIQGNITIFSLDMLPRTTRAQSMDVLSSQANIAGYKAVLVAANAFPRYFPMFMTAAGSIPPAKVLVLGAGVAGLQAIATAKRLGAVVEVFDTRPAVKEEVQSLGAKFVEVEGAADASKAGGYAVEQSEEFKNRQKQRIAESVAKSDIIITTAQIPGRKAPILVTEAMLQTMKSGSIIVDLAAATGGNTEFTQNGTAVNAHNVTIIGDSNLPESVPFDASKMYGKNICNFLQLIIDKSGNLKLNFEDELVAGSCITHQGNVMNERVKMIVNTN